MPDLNKSDYWKTLNPGLAIDGPNKGTAEIFINDSDLTRIADGVLDQGYIYEPPLISADIIAPLHDGIIALEAAGYPPVFIYLYDEAWQIFAKLSPLIRQFLGDSFRLLPNFWAWNLPLKEGASGWPAHVDCQAETRFKIGVGEEILMSLSLWIPLTDATVDNGCMHVLPRPQEERYDPPITDPENIKNGDARALPAKTGSVLGWPQDLWHWGGSVTGKATHQRMSLSLEFQNPAFDPLAEPLLDIANPPPFAERLGLIREQFSKYAHMETVNFDPDFGSET